MPNFLALSSYLAHENHAYVIIKEMLTYEVPVAGIKPLNIHNYQLQTWVCFLD